MLTKPLNLLLVFLLAIVHFFILLIPLAIVSSPLLVMAKDAVKDIAPLVFFFVVFCMTSYMLLYLFLDLIFGFTIRTLCKGAIPLNKAVEEYPYPGLDDAFAETKQRFNTHNVSLYIDKNASIINAYAISSLRHRRIVMTVGLLDTILKQASSKTEFTDAVRGILGHEMSHLVNKDFLPGLLIASNHAAHRFLARILSLVFILAANILNIIPIIGQYIALTIIMANSLLNRIVNILYRWVINPIFEFIKRTLNRSVEYRCDRESAFAFGGSRMATGLSMLGESNYFSLFSTHPNTIQRIKKVKDIKAKTSIITPSFLTQLSNIASLIGLVALCAYSGKKAEMWVLYRYYRYYIHQHAADFLNNWFSFFNGLF